MTLYSHGSLSNVANTSIYRMVVACYLPSSCDSREMLDEAVDPMKDGSVRITTIFHYNDNLQTIILLATMQIQSLK